MADLQAIQARRHAEEQTRQERARQQQAELSPDLFEPISYGSPWPWAALSLLIGGGVVATLASMTSEQRTALVAAFSIGGLFLMYNFTLAILMKPSND